MKSVIRILVSSRDDLSREGLLRLLAKTRYKATPAKGDLDAVLETDHRNALIIVVLGKDEGIPAPTLHALTQRCKVVLLADRCDGAACYGALCAGAAAYLPRTISGQGLLDTLDMVLEGEVVFPSILVEEVLHCPRKRPFASLPSPDTLGSIDGSTKLSTREIDIIRGLVQGASNKRISRDLNIAETTVKVHVKTILRKLRASNRTQAAIWGMTHLPALPQTSVEPPEAPTLSAPPLDAALPALRCLSCTDEHQPTTPRLAAIDVIAGAARAVRSMR